eukprot:Skav229643  [mRNA]  locus=scaffold649:315966:343554:- [translate_table: standard]
MTKKKEASQDKAFESMEFSYHFFVTQGAALKNEASGVIEVDVPRTGCEEALFEPLRRLLLAFAARNPALGYCQSMNFIAAALLRYCDEESAFWILCSLLEDILPEGYYTVNMVGIRVDMLVLNSLIMRYLPNLHKHFTEQDVDLSPVSMNWFLCLYINTLAETTRDRVLDCLLHEGSKVLFRAALALLRSMESQLLAANGVAAVYDLLRSPVEDDLVENMYGFWLQGFSTDILIQLRDQHLVSVTSQDSSAAFAFAGVKPSRDDSLVTRYGGRDWHAGNVLKKIDFAPSPQLLVHGIGLPRTCSCWRSWFRAAAAQAQARAAKKKKDAAFQEKFGMAADVYGEQGMDQVKAANEARKKKQEDSHDGVWRLIAQARNVREIVDKFSGFVESEALKALLRLLGIANAKQRKALCRDLKGKFAALAKNSVDYVVVMRMATTVDDTVMLSKSMIAEWLQDIEEICFDKYGHKAAALVLTIQKSIHWPGDPHLFTPFERQCMALPSPTSLKAKKDDLGLLNNGTVTTTLLILLKLEPEQAQQYPTGGWAKAGAATLGELFEASPSARSLAVKKPMP